MDETHENETSAKITNTETKKLKIVTSLSNLITFVLKMLTTEIGDMNNNKEVDSMVTNILSAPTLVELLNKLDDDNADDFPRHHHTTSSSLSSSSWSSSCSVTSDSDDANLIGDDVADSGFLTTSDLQCPECGQNVPDSRQDLSNPGFPRQVYNIAYWTEDADSGLLWCEEENEVSSLCHSPAPSHQDYRRLVSKEVSNDINERKCETVEKEECQSAPKTDSLSSLCPASADTRSDPFFTKVSNAISSVAPNFIFDKVKSLKRGNKRRAKQAAKVVPNEFRTLWRSLFEKEDVSIETPAPYPKVDWSSVNSRFIKNIPLPSSFPILGCSQDPGFYKLERTYGQGMQSKFSSHTNPFGFAYGYQTNQGVVCVPEKVHHGYIWDYDHWTLHATLPAQPQHQERREGTRRGKRGGRRGERGRRKRSSATYSTTLH